MLARRPGTTAGPTQASKHAVAIGNRLAPPAGGPGHAVPSIPTAPVGRAAGGRSPIFSMGAPTAQGRQEKGVKGPVCHGFAAVSVGSIPAVIGWGGARHAEPQSHRQAEMRPRGQRFRASGRSRSRPMNAIPAGEKPARK